MRIEHLNLDGTGPRRTQVYDMPAYCRTREGDVRPVAPGEASVFAEYWPAVTDVPCPAQCGGSVRWAEAGYVPGYRICDRCGRHWLAGGTADAPTLRRMGSRRSRPR